MGAVAGIVHLGGEQVSACELDHLLDGMNTWGLGVSSLAAEGACLGSAGTDNRVPSRCLGGTALITVAARLDNREELADLLEVGSHADPNLSDECLVVRAFERWGEACAGRLNGDWSLAAWSPAKRRLFLARDHFGNTGLYFARCGERVAFASDLTSLLRLRWLPRSLNETRIASFLVGGGIDAPSSTVYREVSRLPPAHSMTIARGEERLARYWRVEDTPDSGPPDPVARAEMLRTTLRAAVRSRLRDHDHVGTMLSGGLDSGAVTAFAAEYLRSHQRRLTAFTAVPAFPTGALRPGAGCTDEGPSAADVVRSFDSIDHILVRARTTSPIAGIRHAFKIHGEPVIAAANYGWVTELMAEARARGIKVLLTGQVGDFVMAGRPAPRGWRRDWTAGNFRSMLRRASPNWLLRLRRVEWKPWRLAEAPWRTYSAVNPDFAAEIQLVERMRDAGRDPRDLKASPGLAGIIRPAMSDIGALWPPLGAEYGLTIHDPLQDRRVMEQMFSGPRPSVAGAKDRWLFRQSLIGVLPESVRLSRSKGMQSADIVERLRASWPDVEDALCVAEGSPLARRCVDMPYCRDLAESIRSARVPSHAMENAFMLLNGISAALFVAEAWES